MRRCATPVSPTHACASPLTLLVDGLDTIQVTILLYMKFHHRNFYRRMNGDYSAVVRLFAVRTSSGKLTVSGDHEEHDRVNIKPSQYVTAKVFLGRLSNIYDLFFALNTNCLVHTVKLEVNCFLAIQRYLHFLVFVSTTRQDRYLSHTLAAAHT